MAKKVLMKVLPTNLPDLEEPCLIFLLNKIDKFTIGPNIDVSKISPGFMLKIDFSFFNVESIRGFSSTFLAICSATSHPFRFTYRIKHPTFDIIKLFVTILRNHYNKVTFIQVDEYGALERYYEFIKTRNNTNIIVQTTGGDASSLNGIIEIPNRTLDNIIRYLQLK